jgi:hypothetical protein
LSCPQCATVLENYSRCEGGWCPKCEEWWPSDIVEEHLAEQFPQEEDPEDGMLWINYVVGERENEDA